MFRPKGLRSQKAAHESDRKVDKLCHSDASLVAAKAFAKKALRADTTLDCSLGRTATVVAQVDPM